MRDLFLTRLAAAAETTDAMLDRLLTPEAERGEVYRPKLLIEAMRYAVLSPGKRLRPFIVIETARLFHRHDEGVTRAAAALECVHASSLIHDDLPGLDNDDERCGRPTVHKQFGEATAILAGDALLTLAFDILADPAVDRDPLLCAAMIGALARAAGVGGMIGGQMLDIEGEGRALNEDQIARVHAMQTGALFRFAAQAGAFLGHAAEEDRHRLLDFGSAFGRACQIADDLIEVMAAGAPAESGNAAAVDTVRGKAATVITSHGLAEAKTMLGLAAAEAVQHLEFFGARADILAEAARYVAIGGNETP